MRPAAPATSGQALRVDHSPGRSVTVAAGGAALFTYRYLDEPRLHPVHTLDGKPAVTGAVGWALPRIAEHPMLQTAGAEGGRLTELAATDAAVTVAHRLTWTDRCGRAAVDEWRALTALHADDTSWVLLFENTITNVAGAPFTIAGGGGLRWPTTAGFAVLVLVDDSTNPVGGSPVAPGRTVAFRHAAVIASADRAAAGCARAGERSGPAADALAALGRAVLGAEAWHGCAATHARSVRRAPAISPATPPGWGRRPRR